MHKVDEAVSLKDLKKFNQDLSKYFTELLQVKTGLVTWTHIKIMILVLDIQNK